VRFTDKVAVVTGAGQGIGEAYARALAAEGASVVVAEINEEQGQRVADEIGAGGGQAVFVRTDVSSEASTTAMGAAAVEAFGGVDYLVNNAAIYGGMQIESLLKVDWDYYERFMAVNMHGALLCTRAVYRSAPAGRWGHRGTSRRQRPGCTRASTASRSSASTAHHALATSSAGATSG
jgi:NAD(P)-dependent dehydrogenase (short-subunit alcohol dehydrogenase family)